jgi:hypothetical protein
VSVPGPDTSGSFPPDDTTPPEGLVVPPARFWAILYGAEATAEELAHIRGRAALRDIALTVLRQRNDPRLHLFELDA